MKNKYISYRYELRLESGEIKNFEFLIDKNDLNLVEKTEPIKPYWALRKEFGCVNDKCDLKPDDYCPIALTTNKLISHFHDISSTVRVAVKVISNDRIYSKETSFQQAVSSISGILMSTCGCPILGKLKPLVRFHLPFSTLEETEFRVFSMFLLAQYFKERNGLTVSENFDELKELYAEIQVINRLSAQKIQEIERSDATINGLVILDTFALSVTFNLDDDDFTQMESLFSEWLKPTKKSE
ncbi:MAG: hypothetical protein KF816_15960 [Melioribacteraceae bacterium]|nr:hypothetical protein [Melioribacteraceae bacterium]